MNSCIFVSTDTPCIIRYGHTGPTVVDQQTDQSRDYGYDFGKARGKIRERLTAHRISEPQTQRSINDIPLTLPKGIVCDTDNSVGVHASKIHQELV